MRKLWTCVAVAALAVGLSSGSAAAAADTSAPAVSITTPDGAILPYTLDDSAMVRGVASDDTGVSLVVVSFMMGASTDVQSVHAGSHIWAHTSCADGRKSCTWEVQPPREFFFHMLNIPGVWTVTATAWDSAGNKTVSAPITVLTA